MCGNRIDEQGKAQGVQLVAPPRSRTRLAGGLRHHGADRRKHRRRLGVSRAEQEAFALDSHIKANAALEAGAFEDEIIPIIDGQDIIASDGCIRSDSTLEAMAALKPVFSENGTVTAATSSPLTDGAVAMIVCSEEFAADKGLDAMATICGGAVSGCSPEVMGIGLSLIHI